MNCICIKFAGNARFRFVLAEAEHANAGHQDNGGVRIPHLRRVGLGKRRVVSSVLFSVLPERRVNRLAQSWQVGCWMPRNEKRSDFSADEMVRTTGSEMCEFGGIS